MAIDFDSIRRDYPLPEIVASSGVKLEKDGAEFTACCPFHGDKTPSFSVFRASKGGLWRFFCFGCGANGDVIDFVCERYGKTKPAAVEIITGQAPDARPRDIYREPKDPYAGYEVRRPPPDAPPAPAP